MILSGPIFEVVYLAAVVVIWSALLYQALLTAAGYLYSRRKPARHLDPVELPRVSILVPARDEEEVIRSTVEHLLGLDYPREKIDVIIINDGSSDRTREILESIRDPRLTVLHVPRERSGQGKSRALNSGIRRARGELIAVYDADNRPDPASLRLLVDGLMADRSYSAAIRKFRCLNKSRALLTRFVNIETMSFQWIIQAGRSFLFRIAILPGTNFVIWKQAVIDAGGWDEKALTEDAELSMRLYRAGRKIRFVPRAVTWEQEPETVRVWLRQRERWVRGNNYVFSKLIRIRRDFKSSVIGWEFVLFSSMYYIFFAAMYCRTFCFCWGCSIWRASRSAARSSRSGSWLTCSS